MQLTCIRICVVILLTQADRTAATAQRVTPMIPTPTVPWPSAGLPPGLATSAFQSRDCDEVRAHVGHLFCDHAMQVINRRGQLDTRTRSFACRSVTFSDMGYGADVLVTPGQLGGFYLVQIPLAGKGWVSLAGQQHACLPGMASVQDPERAVDMYWSADCRKIVLRFDRGGLERFAELHTGRRIGGALLLRPTVELASPSGAALMALLNSVANLPVGTANDLSPVMKAHLETCFMSAMLMLQPGLDSESASPGDRFEPPQAVRKVRDYLHAHAHEPVDLAALAGVSGVPLRTLHHQFKRTLGVTPLQLLRDIRLDRVRAELLRAAPGTNVTSVALDWGFDHLGRFAASYRERFGEAPRDTLQRLRAH